MSDDGELKLHNEIESEQAVLGCLLLKPELIALVQPVLSAHDFHRKLHGFIYGVIVSLADFGEPVDITTVWSRLKRTKTGIDRPDLYLVALLDSVGSTYSCEYHARRVANAARVRQGQKYALDRLVHASDPETILEAREYFDDLSKNVVATGMEPVGSLSEEFFDALDKRMRGISNDAFKCGPGALDSITGGYFRETFNVIGARPSMGKSALMVSQALTAAMQPIPKSSAIFSLEMSSQQLMQRFLQLMTGIDGTLIRDGKITPAQMCELMVASEELKKLPLFIYDKAVSTVAEIRGFYKKLPIKADQVWIDYIQMMSSGADDEVRYLSDLGKGFKDFAKEENCAVNALSQLSRKCEDRQDKRPRDGDLRGSGGIEQAADQIIYIYRDERYNPETVYKGEAELIVQKNRMGIANRTAYVAYRDHLCQFLDLPENYERPQLPEIEAAREKRKGNYSFRGKGPHYAPQSND